MLEAKTTLKRHDGKEQRMDWETARILKFRKRPVVRYVQVDGPENSNPFFVTFYVTGYRAGRDLSHLIRHKVFNGDFEACPDIVLFNHSGRRGRKNWGVSFRLTAISNADSPVVIIDSVRTRARMYSALVDHGYMAAYDEADDMALAA